MNLFKINMKSPLFYRIINILSLILVIISLVMAFLLYEKRQKLAKNNEKIISSLHKVSIILDSGTGTLKSDKSLTNNTESLGVDILRIEKQVRGIIKQRNNSAKAMVAISSNLQLPTKYTKKQFQSTETYQKTEDEVVKFAEKINDRNNLLTDCFVRISNDIQQPIDDEEAFITANKNLEGYSDALSNLIENVKVVADELSNSKKSLITNDSKIKKLEKELLSVSDSSGGEFKSLIAEYEKQLEELQKTNSELTKTISIKQQPVSIMSSAQIETMHPDKKTEYEKKIKEIKSQLYLKLTGKILKYDKKWGFAIIDLGKFNKVDFEVDDRKETATVGLPLNKEMYVSHENKFVAKVKIIKVVNKYAVVNLSSPSDGIIQPGDSIFFPIQ